MKDSIAAFWLKESKKGTKFMSGSLKVPDGWKPGDEIDVVMFRNNKGDNPRRPDYRLFVSEPREEQSREQSKPETEFDDGVPF